MCNGSGQCKICNEAKDCLNGVDEENCEKSEQEGETDKIAQQQKRLTSYLLATAGVSNRP